LVGFGFENLKEEEEEWESCARELPVILNATDCNKRTSAAHVPKQALTQVLESTNT
jgi:hypothetical protein